MPTSNRYHPTVKMQSIGLRNTCENIICISSGESKDDHFQYRNGEAYCEDINLKDIATSWNSGLRLLA